MRISATGAAMVTGLLVLAAPLPAQAPAPAAKMPPPAGAMTMDMKMMDSMNARLDSAVARMNRTTGDARVAAMADVLNALVAEHRMMHAHMDAMMGDHMGGMPGMARPDSAAPPRR